MNTRRRNNPFSHELPTRNEHTSIDRINGVSHLKDTGPQRNTPADIPADDLFDAAIRILLLERSFVITFDAGDIIRIRFPATRRLAEFTGIPHYLVLRSCAGREQENLLVKAERAGIVTTGEGSRMMIGIVKARYLQEAGEILGCEILAELIRKAGCSE